MTPSRIDGYLYHRSSEQSVDEYIRQLLRLDPIGAKADAGTALHKYVETFRYGIALPEQFESDDWKFTNTIKNDLIIDYPILREISHARKFNDDVTIYGDYLASLAKAMLNNDELCESLYWEFQSRIENKDIDFYAKIAWKEKDRTKPRYFSKDLNRISAVKSKQFDRRFEPITDEMDGTPEFIFKMLSSEYNSLLKQYNIANSILDYVNSRNNEKKYYSYMPYPAEFLKWSEDATIIRAIYQGWNACKLASQVYCVKKQTTTAINNFMNYTIQSKLES